MKHISLSLLLGMTLALMSCTTDSDDDDSWDAAKVCPETGTNTYGMPNRGTFTDERDGQVYKYTTIGNQVWMAENLRYDAPYSTCSNDTSFIRQYCELIEHNCETEACCKESLCRTFGRYYSIIEGGAEFGLIDSALADTICPKGWHIPTKEEWENLENAMKASGDNNSDVANRMKSADSVYFAISRLHLNESDRSYVGSNDCALTVLPSGFMFRDGETLKNRASLWTFTQKNADFVYTFRVANDVGYVSHNYRNSIRCMLN